MTDTAILQELGLPVFIMREQKTTAAVIIPAVVVSETKTEFSETHQIQLSKIMHYLGYQAHEYQLYFADNKLSHSPLLAFGTTTHSISAMLSNPACKREVLNAIQHLRRHS